MNRHGRALAAIALGALALGVMPPTDVEAKGLDIGGVGSSYYLNDSFSASANIVFSYGRADDVVLVGDWDGNGTDTLAVRRGNAYYIKNTMTSGIADVVIWYGRPDDEVLVGDWDGDGDDTLAVRRDNTYYIKNTLTSGVADVVLAYGRATDTAFSGDWNGDGKDTLGVRRPPAAYDPAAWIGVDWEVLPTTSKVVALTFDGGASDAGVNRILYTLDAYNVPASFFVTGDFARRYPTSVRAMNAGFRVGNHSDTHPYFTQLTNDQIHLELARAEASISALTGRTTHPTFRFPYGDRPALDISVVNSAGYVPFRWTVDTLGWKGTSGGITAGIVCQRVLDTARPGQIVLMHVGANPDDGSTLDADALPCVIEGLRAKGYWFVSLRDFVG